LSKPIRLKVIPAQGSAFDFLFSGEQLLIGRSSTADLVIDDESLSRQHARLFREDGELWIEDLGSQNGTWVNAVRARRAMRVPPGALIKLSNTIVTVQGGVGATRPKTAPSGEALTDGTLFRNATEMLRIQEEETAEEAARGQDSQRHLKRLKILNEVHRAVADTTDIDELLALVIDKLFEHLHPEECVIFLKDDDGALRPAASQTLPGLKTKFPYSRRLKEEVTEKGMAALVHDVQLDKRFSGSASMVASGVRSLAAAPLISRGGSLGMIALASRAYVRQFSEDDLELLVSLASIVSLRIRNLALAEEEVKRERLEQELKLARRIQTALLPAKLPNLEGYALYGGNWPSLGVSGDYYEVVPRLDGRECLLLAADVSGKGMSASLLTATLEALSAGPIEDGLPPHEICLKLSRMLYKRTPADRYATMFMAALTPETGVLHFCNAGHNPALLVRADGSVEALEATGLPLGLLPFGEYEIGEKRLLPGDTLAVYTDGLTEANNPADEEFGQKRLEASLREGRALPLDDLAERLFADLERFAAGQPYGDDRTLVMARRL